MRIDNYIRDLDSPLDPKEIAFCKKFEAIVVKQLDMPYADVVHAYRQLEDEFINRPDYNEWEVLETKRRIAEIILRVAHDTEQPFEVCQDAWNTLVGLGFSNFETYCTKAWFYADCCLFNAHYDVGLEVLDMIFTEIHRRLEEPGLTHQGEKYYDGELTTLGKLREGLIAHKSGEAEGIAWDERREAEIEARPDPSPQEWRGSQLIGKLFDVTRPVRKTSSDLSFAEIVREYRKAEAQFLAQLQSSDEFFVPEVHRHIASAILEEAHKQHEPFEVCRDAWDELLRWGFGKLEDKCSLTRTYADCCLFNKQPNAGLVVVDPLLAEIQKHVDQGTDTEMPRQRYPREIARLTKLRDELRAL